MEKHISLKGYPVLFFFANIVDPDEKFGVDDIVKALCNKFDIEPPNTEYGYSTLNNKLIKFVENEQVRELFFQLPLYGFVRVYKEYRVLKYKEHKMEFNYFTELQINTNHTEVKRGWDEDKMNHFKDTLFTLYDKEQEDNVSWTDVFNACWVLLEKGNIDNARNIFIRAIELLIKQHEENSTLSYPKQCTKYAYFIKEKWDEYLWSKNEQDTLHITEYWLGLQEFINRNLDAWIDRLENHVVMCRIYTDEHESISKEFNMLNEQYIKLWGKIAIQDERN